MNKIKLLFVFILFLVPFSLYLNTLRADFVRCGSQIGVQNNPFQPVTSLSFSIDHSLWKQNPHGFHLTNIVLNALSSSAVFILALFLSKPFLTRRESIFFAFTTSLLYSVHPAHSETVSNLNGRSMILCSIFFNISFALYFISFNKQKYYLTSLLFFLFALLSNPFAVTLPVLIVLYDYLFKFESPRTYASGTTREGIKNRLKFYLGYFILLTVFVLMKLISLTNHNIYSVLRNDIDNAFIIFKTTAEYLKILILPVTLYPDRNPVVDAIAYEPLTMFGLGIFIASFYLFFRYRNEFTFFVSWFLITLIPAIVFSSFSSISDINLYIPSIGLCLLAGRLFVFSIDFESPLLRRGGLAIFISTICLFSYITAQQNEVWKTPYSLLKHTVKVDPGNFTANYELGVTAKKENKYLEAENYLWKAIALKNDSLEAYSTLSALYFENRLYNKAIETYLKTIEIVSYQEAKGKKMENSKFIYYKNLAESYLNTFTYNLAIQNYLKAIEFNDADSSNYYGCALSYMGQRKFNDAIRYLQKAIELNPSYSDAYVQLGGIYYSQNKATDAVEQYLNAIKHEPSNFYANYNLGTILEKKDPVNALIYWKTALSSINNVTKKNEMKNRLQLHISKLEANLSENINIKR